jgi:anaerobic magnesium-protoporphyrin IX monomethyl ester cyclase
MYTNQQIKSVLFIVASPVEKGKYANALPPLGILSMATVLRNKGFKADVTDCCIESLDKHNIAEYDLIGFSIMISNIENTLKTINEVKQNYPEKLIIIGGPHVNSNPTFFFENKFIDLIAVGESERTILELMEKKSPIGVRGLYYKDEKNKTVFNGERERIRNLDELPFPDLSLVDYKKYDVIIKKKKYISSIMTTRGCPFSCTFCFHSIGRQWAARSPENVVDEIEYQVKKFGIKEICIFDDNFTLNVARAKKICRLIIDRKINVILQFTNGIRVDRVDKELLQLLKDAGLWLVGVAPESGSAETLQKINKKFNLDKVEEVVRWCHEIGLNTHSYFMVGFPWETREHIQKSIDLSLKLDTDLTQFSRVVPLPGTKLFEQMELDINEGFERDRGLFYGNVQHSIEKISEAEIHKLIKKGYRAFYFNPIRIWRIFKMLSLVSLLRLVKYSLTTESV